MAFIIAHPSRGSKGPPLPHVDLTTALGYNGLSWRSSAVEAGGEEKNGQERRRERPFPGRGVYFPLGRGPSRVFRTSSHLSGREAPEREGDPLVRTLGEGSLSPSLPREGGGGGGTLPLVGGERGGRSAGLLGRRLRRGTGGVAPDTSPGEGRKGGALPPPNAGEEGDSCPPPLLGDRQALR